MWGLSARLLVLTVFFVMLAEVLIFAPSAARFRLSYLDEKLFDAHLVARASQATPHSADIHEDVVNELLDYVNAYMVDVAWPGAETVMISRAMPPVIDDTVDLRDATFVDLVRDAFVVLTRSDNRVLRVIGHSPLDARAEVTVVIDERPLRLALVDFSGRILALSIMISLITAALVYLSLQLLIVRPILRMSENMVMFGENPENASRAITPGRRGDEIGVAQRELARMQQALRDSLHQKSALAALGAAVAKINHDLRNMLSSALLVSDLLATVDEPKVRKVTPTLVRSIERAVSLCGQVLRFARQETPQPQCSVFAFADLAAELEEEFRDSRPDCALRNHVAAAVRINADRDQVFRVLENLTRNAFEAGAHTVDIDAHVTDSAFVLDLTDDGCGVPDTLRERLFTPFSGSTKPDGSGLGLAISRDLVRGHGGDIELVATGPSGTRFRITLPIRDASA